MFEFFGTFRVMSSKNTFILGVNIKKTRKIRNSSLIAPFILHVFDFEDFSLYLKL